MFTKKKKYRFQFYVSLNAAGIFLYIFQACGGEERGELNKTNAFDTEITEATTPESTFTISVNGSSWTFAVETEELKQQWVTALKNCIETLRSSSVNFEGTHAISS